MPSATRSRVLLAASAAALLAAACASTKANETEAQLLAMADGKSIVPASRAEREAAERTDLLSQATFWGAEYEKNPNDYESALKFAGVLRGIGSSGRATEVTGQALALKPGDLALTMIHAKALLDTGRPDAAVAPLARAEAQGQTDPDFLSLVGVTMDQLGRHETAQQYYNRALNLAKDDPSILSNLALSYALQGEAGLAEQTLRRAVALPDSDHRVRQNLALVLGVQGKFEEARTAAGADAPAALVESNTAYFRALLSPARSWDTLRGSSN